MKNKHYIKYLNTVTDRPLLFNIVIWTIILLVLSWLTSLNGNWPFSFYLLNMLVSLPSMIIFNYVMVWLLNELLFKGRKSFVYILFFAVMTATCSLLIPIMNHWLFFGLLFPRVLEPTPWFNWHHVPQNLILLWFPFLIFTLKTLFKHWFKAEQEKLIIENKRLLAEIQLMKIKLHPHFLFNTLNNLYAMAKVNSQYTPDYIMKLSEIYRIMLYECNKDFYPVNEELRLIRNYIELEKIRYDERLKLDVQIPDFVNSELMIAPLLLFTFVENSFKHGCRNDIGKSQIMISVSVDADYLSFYSLNSVPNGNQPKKTNGGIGLENTHKRLDLIYEDEYQYEFGLIDNKYEVKLKIPNLHSS